EQRGLPSKPLVLSHVTVIDVAAGRVKPGMTVIITGDRIEAVGPSGSVSTPGNALVVDATGKFLIPGLWDAHYHLAHEFSANWAREVSLPLLVANGITGVRDMGAISNSSRHYGRKSLRERFPAPASSLPVLN
ncbi:MAG: hypothetical protein WA741_01705, partial [Candidatus Sulfotelmatobacter sp.]